MTEEEAKTKACVAGNRGVGEWRNETPDDPFGGRYYCIGSACMAWRWENLSDKERLHIRAATKFEIPFNYVGYCGLAGKP